MRITLDMASCGPERGRALVSQLEVMGFELLPAENEKAPLQVYAYKRETDPTDLIYAKQKLARYGAIYVGVSGDNLPDAID